MKLDFQKIYSMQLDITLGDGKQLHIPIPNRELLAEIVKINEITEQSPQAEQYAALDKLAKCILNSNTDGLLFDDRCMQIIPDKLKEQLIESYSEFMNIAREKIQKMEACKQRKMRFKTAVQSFLGRLR